MGRGVTSFESLFRLDGKSVLVAGGYGAIGEHIADLLVAAGASVALAGRSQEKADAAAARHDERASGVALDVVDEESVERGVATAAERLGGLDVVVNCASILVEEPADTLDPDDWRRVLDTNLTGAFWLSRVAARRMREAGTGGRIIHFSSTRSAVGGRRGFSAYSASKGGLNALVKQLATEWAGDGITVNAVAPGFVATEFVEGLTSDQSFQQMLLRRIPLGRFGEADEVAATAVFLATPAAGFITGQIIFVDGGVTASS